MTDYTLNMMVEEEDKSHYDDAVTTLDGLMTGTTQGILLICCPPGP